jgi:hypothetical protein
MSPLTVLTNPDRFFDRASDDPSLLPALGVVLVVGVVGAIAAVPFFQLFQQMLPEEASGFSSIIAVFSIAGAFIGALIGWVVLTAVFHAISAVAFDGEGDFSTNLAYVGWGHMPGIIGGVISAALNFYGLQNITPPSNIEPQQMQGWIQSIQSDPIFQVATGVGIVFLLWQGFLWTFAVKHARNLTLREAAITVGVPVGLWALWQVFNLVQPGTGLV